MPEAGLPIMVWPLSTDEIRRLRLAAPGGEGRLNGVLYVVFMAAVLAHLVLQARSGRFLSGADVWWLAVPCVVVHVVCWRLRRIRLLHWVGSAALVAAVWFLASIGVDDRVDSVALNVLALVLTTVAAAAGIMLWRRTRERSVPS